MVSLTVSEDSPDDWMSSYSCYGDPYAERALSLIVEAKCSHVLIEGSYCDPIKKLGQQTLRTLAASPIMLHVITWGRYKLPWHLDNVYITVMAEENYHWMVHPGLAWDEIIYKVGFNLHWSDVAAEAGKPVFLTPLMDKDHQNDTAYFQNAIGVAKHYGENVRVVL
jgi:hypothetical protein